MKYFEKLAKEEKPDYIGHALRGGFAGGGLATLGIPPIAFADLKDPDKNLPKSVRNFHGQLRKDWESIAKTLEEGGHATPETLRELGKKSMKWAKRYGKKGAIAGAIAFPTIAAIAQ